MRLALGLVLLCGLGGSAAAATRPLLTLPVLLEGPQGAECRRVAQGLREVPPLAGYHPLPEVRASARLDELLVAGPGTLTEARVRQLERDLEQGNQAFLRGRFEEAAATLERLRGAASPLLHALQRERPQWVPRIFGGAMTLGRTLDALGRNADAQEVFRSALRSFPAEAVDESAYPPSLVQRCAALRAESATRTGSLTVHLDGAPPRDPERCEVSLDAGRWGGIGRPLPGIPQGDYRLAVDCEGGLHSADYRLELGAGHHEITVYLAHDAPLRWGDDALGLELGANWLGEDYRGPAVAAGRLLEAARVVVVGPAPAGEPGLELVLVDPEGRKVLRQRRLAVAEIPQGVDGYRALLASLLAEGEEAEAPLVLGPAPATGRGRFGLATWLSGGATVALGLGTLVTGLVYRDDLASFQDCRDDLVCQADRGALVEQRDRVAREEWMTNLGLGATALGVVTTSVLVFLDLRAADAGAGGEVGSCRSLIVGGSAALRCSF